MALKRMDNVGIVVDDLGGTIDFFRELGLELEGRAFSLISRTSVIHDFRKAPSSGARRLDFFTRRPQRISDGGVFALK